MKKFILIALIILAVMPGCNDEEFLDREPTSLLLDEQLWQDESLVFSLVSDLYWRINDYQSVKSWWEYTNFDEAFASNAGDYWRHRDLWDYGYDWWRLWDYGYMRELNLFIQKCEAADETVITSKARFLAEGRFIRATLYFEMVKRMGGVPLILEPLTYDFSGDPSYLQYPRAKEHEVYDFILSELDDIKADLPNDVNVKSRATQGLVLAMKSRVALYAASIAKYGANTPEVTLPDGEVGISSSMANAYYQTAFDAAEELIGTGPYSLYNKKENLSENFARLFQDKSNNPEVIFAKDYVQSMNNEESNPWTLVNQPWGEAEDLEGGRLNPSLNLAQLFEKVDNTYEPFQTNAEDGDWIYYDDPMDIFKDRDARLAGTIMLPGSTFKGKPVDIWAGFMLADGSVISSDKFGDTGSLPGKDVDEQVVGKDGPIDGLEWGAQTGFYVRKFMDEATGSGQRGVKSDVWWVRYRLAEVYLNAAEAAFELGHPDVAATYMNTVRTRAGLTIPLDQSDISFDRIVNERKVELAFEGHELWDMKRWRLAHQVWNGEAVDLSTNIGVADEIQTRVFGLWPYKYYDENGSENNYKYVFKVVKPSNVIASHRFRMGNYYSSISDGVINSNPLIVRNPNHN
ncbi:RagB/SusD family nutrient uptake outer membrane protein [Carboxylicivirga caseinilyticus]|uniref:RagB/SusD family nutrient uptake outer membrane protein n=1 Tax=Carboxylicivirga caseinilyticus TaxID=3417572 RepID=UPI003D32A5CF|nr:RagB/SusD family nutrient uptake outer membrane protein [Marinilabiliaceae bacterium A049]